MKSYTTALAVATALIAATSGADAAHVMASSPADPAIRQPALFDPKRPLDRELRMHVADGFSVVAVGDLIISRPLSQYASNDANFRSVLNLLRQADVTYGNLETTIFDMRTFEGAPYSWAGDWTNSSLPAVAQDLKGMGFDLVSRANNHSLDWGIEGMRVTSHYLDLAGISYAGVGNDRGTARAPAFYETTRGRVGLVSFASTYRPTSDALPARGQTPARPGVSALAVSQRIVVPAEAMADLARASCRVYNSPCGAPPRRLELFGNSYETGGHQLVYRYEIDPEDAVEIDQDIRDGKQNSDFLIAAIHSHECSIGCDDPRKPYLPALFLKDVAHDAIDSGADEFVATGIHNLGPIEIYKARPIFYGLANFFWSDVQPLLPHDLFQQNRKLLHSAYHHPELATPYDLSAVLNEQAFANTFTFQSVVAKCIFAHDRLEQIRLYAVDLGYGSKLTESGIPHLATPATAAAIFRRIAQATSQFNLPPLNMHVSGSVATIVP